MAGTLSDSGKNDMLSGIAATALWYSLHTADPSTTGANEVAGGAPAYARKAATWNAPVAGNLDNSNAPVFDVPPATTVAYWGLWTLGTAGVFKGGGPLSAAETFVAQGQYTLNDGDITI